MLQGVDFNRLRRRVLRRGVFAANAVALSDKRVPPEGPYDTAVANGLAAIVAFEQPGAELSDKGWVHMPRQLVALARDFGAIAAEEADVLLDGIDLSQPFRHGRAEDDWTRITDSHVKQLLQLDAHPALEVLERARTGDGDFEQLIVSLYLDEVGELLPLGKDRLLVPDPEECSNCWRMTFMGDGWDEFGVGLAAGSRCIACGYERTDDDVVDEALQRAMDRPD